MREGETRSMQWGIGLLRHMIVEEQHVSLERDSSVLYCDVKAQPKASM